jgi:hypothetical protein
VSKLVSICSGNVAQDSLRRCNMRLDKEKRPPEDNDIGVVAIVIVIALLLSLPYIFKVEWML